MKIYQVRPRFENRGMPANRTSTRQPAGDRNERVPGALQQKMEAAFGHDFSKVRVYDSQSARQMGAVAFTQGTEIHLAPGAVDLSTSLGEAILGHELAHVAQQRSGRVAAPPTTGATADRTRPLEDEANEAGVQAALGRSVSIHRPDTSAQSPTNPAIQMVEPEDVESLAQQLLDEKAESDGAKAKKRAKHVLRFEELRASDRREENKRRNPVQPSPEITAKLARVAAEQKELQKWNPNAEGRNQGLTHILDYAYARPPLHAEAERLSGGHPISGRKLMERLGLTPKGFANFAATNLEEYRSENEDLGKPLLRVAERKAGQGPIKHTNPQGLEAEVQDLNAEMEQQMKVPPAQKKAVGLSAGYKDLRQQKADKESSLLLEKGYRVKRDESKKGRIEHVEQAVGRAPGAFKSNEGEITGVTQALDALTGNTRPVEVKEPTGGTKTLPKEWVPTGQAGKHAQWTEQRDVTITDTAKTEKYQTQAAADAPSLEIVKWGPRPDALHYSTVHGAAGDGKKKKK